MSDIIRVAISQRILPDFRVPVFAELATMPGIDLTVYFGKGQSVGSQQNSSHICGFKHKQLFTISMNLDHRGIEKYRVFHPTLPLHILAGHYDVIITEPSTNIFNNIFLFPLCKIFRKKFIWYTAGPTGIPSWIRKVMMSISQIMIRGADACITYNSSADKDLLKRGVSPKKIFRAQNTVDTRQIKKDSIFFRSHVSALKKKLQINGSRVALYIGGIEKRKRLENLIVAVEMVRNEGLDVKVLIVGDGDYEEELKNNLSEEHKNFTIFTGRRVKDAALYILASDVVVLPGQGGLAINHALACGKPCIATEEAEGPAVRDYIHDGVNGFIVPVNNINGLAEKMEMLFSDSDLLHNLCKGAESVSQELSIEKMVAGIVDAIRYAAKSKKKSEF